MASQPELKTIVGETVASLGYELLGIEYQTRSKNSLLRVYIDSEAGININDCQIVSDQLSAVLDVEDPINGQYTLEVSSPGLDRPLFEKAHYQKYLGREIRVKTLLPIDGRRNFRGKLVSVDDTNVEIEVDKQAYQLALADIQTARLVPNEFNLE